MIYQLVTTDKFDNAFKELDRQPQKLIKSWLDKILMNCTDPCIHGKGLTSNRSGKWRYRVGDYRILAEIQDERLVLVLIDIGHRSRIYK